MSRFDECDDEPFPNAYALWEQAQRRALHGRRGQAVLRELEQALLALPEKKLIHGGMCRDGEVCALGALALKRRIEGGADRREALHALQTKYEEFDDTSVSIDEAQEELGLRPTVVSAIAFANDERCYGKTPEETYEKVLAWMREQLHETARTASGD